MKSRRSFPNRHHRPVRIARHGAKSSIDTGNIWQQYWRDPYHLMLSVSWGTFFMLIAIGYLCINGLFATLYLMGGDCVIGARIGNFEDSFFFSVQTFSSIGYGVMSPKTSYANIIVTIESIMSLLNIAIVTGLGFSRFSRPSARVIFSHHALITTYNGVPTLILRAANERRNHIVEAQAQLYFSRDEMTTEGNRMRRFYSLGLSRAHTPSFALSWNIMHTIDSASPLYEITAEQFRSDNGQFIISIAGIDETVSYNIHVRNVYDINDILWNHQFIDIIYTDHVGDRYIDYTHFHSTRSNEINTNY
jgi:inward rectifier potassium channel